MKLINIDDFNHLVRVALEARETLQALEQRRFRYSFEADADLSICRVRLHPYNGVYAEKAVQTFSYQIEKGYLKTQITNHL